MSEQDEQKTEEPTAKKLEESRKKGQLPISQEVNTFLILSVFAILSAWVLPSGIKQIFTMIRGYIEFSGQLELSPGGVMFAFSSGAQVIFKSLIVVIIILPFSSIIIGFLQNGINFSSQGITPSWDKISPMKALKRLFSKKSVIDLTFSIVKMTMIGAVSAIITYNNLTRLRMLHDISIGQAVKVIYEIIVSIINHILAYYLGIAMLDLVYRRFSHLQELKMSRHEVKEEHRQTEGNPEIKAKLRRAAMEIRKKFGNLSQQISQADLVITNPIHLAVALKYHSEMPAPQVLAKGEGRMAQKIKDLAQENNLPIVENKTVAHLLYKLELGSYIPEKYYEVVAKIIAYAYKSRSRP